MFKFAIARHRRLHEWVARSNGYFDRAGLDHEFHKQRAAAGRRRLRVWLALVFALSPAAACAAEVDWGQAESVDVAGVNHWFEPSQLEFRVGQPYRLHFENRGTELHEFNAAAMFKNSEIRNPEALNPDRTELVVQPGQHKDLFFVPLKAGRYRLVCPDHDWAGMTGEITVR